VFGVDQRGDEQCGDEQREEQCAGAAGNGLTTNGRISPAVANTVPSTLSLPELPCFLA